MTATATCWSCGIERPLSDLMIVTDRHVDRAPWYACRPAVPGLHHDCLRIASGSADDYTVAPAIPDPPRVPRPVRPAPVHDVVYRRGDPR